MKGKVQPISKTQSVKKSASKASSSPAQVSSLSQRSHNAFDAPSCCTCGIVVGDDTKALHCDRCMSADMWKCADCLHLTGEMYDHLVSDSCVALKWLCDSCEKLVMDKNFTGTPNTTSTSSACQNEKLDQLIAVIEKVMNRYETIERKLDSKCDMNEVTKLDARILQLQEKILQMDAGCRELDHRQVSVENQLQLSVMAPSAWKTMDRLMMN